MKKLIIIITRRGHPSVSLVRYYTTTKETRYSCLFSPRCLSSLATVSIHHRKRPASVTSSRHFFGGGLVATLSEAPPVLAVQEMLLRIHDASGLPWWAVIVLTTCVVRSAITLPLAVYQNHVLGRYANLRPEIAELAGRLRVETAVASKRFGWNQRQAKNAFDRSMRKIVQGLILRDNCHPMKASIVLWFQIPLWVSLSFALRNLVSMLPARDLSAQVTFLALSGQGFIWIPNLTVPDASLILPVTLGLTNLLITEIHSLRSPNGSKFQKGLTYVLYAVSVASVPIAASVPSCLSLYWTTSSLFGLFQNLILLSPTFRRIVRIPINVSEVHTSPTPYRDLVNRFRKKINRHEE